MRHSTRVFQETLIRLFKGCLKAWERWLREQSAESETDNQPK